MAAVVGVQKSWLYGLDLIEGADVQSDGHSYGVAGVAGTNQPRTTWFQRAQTRVSASSYTNNNVGGDQAADTAGHAAANATAGFRGLVLWDCTINDVDHSHNATNGLTAYQAGVLTWLWLRRAGARYDSDTYGAETGTFTAATDAGFAIGGTLRQTTAQNAKVTYSVSGATKWAVIVGGGVGSYAMGTIAVQVDGSTVSTANLTGIYASTQNNGSRNWFPYAIPVTLADTGSHTIAVVKTDAATNPVYSDGLVVQSVAPPLIVMAKAIYPTASAYVNFNTSGGSPATNSDIDTFNAALVSTVNGVATDGSILVCDPNADGFTAAAMCGDDGLHPNNWGAAVIASSALAMVRQMTSTQRVAMKLGVNVNGALTQTAVVAANGPSNAVSDTFTRGNSSTALGTADSGQTWTAANGTWGISSNTGYSVTGVNDNRAIISAGITDQAVSVTVTTVTGASPGLIARAADGSNFYLVNFDNNNHVARFFKCVSGSYTQIGSDTTITLAEGDRLGLTVRGTTLTSTQNGSTVATTTDSSITTGSSSGLRIGDGSASLRFDNFTVAR